MAVKIKGTNVVIADIDKAENCSQCRMSENGQCIFNDERFKGLIHCDGCPLESVIYDNYFLKNSDEQSCLINSALVAAMAEKHDKMFKRTKKLRACQK